jgi:integrase
LASLRRDELQKLLNAQSKTHSFSVVDHLRWDLKQIFDMAIAEGLLRLNPAALLFTPSTAKRPVHSAMTIDQVGAALGALEKRERLIAKPAILAGMRPGKIFGLKWGRISDASAEVTQRVYRGKVDTPKTQHSVRSVALTDGVAVDLKEWRKVSSNVGSENLVFPSALPNGEQRSAKTMSGAGIWSRRW